MNSYDYGIFAEKIIIEYLERKQYNIVATRYRKVGYGEIDIIAKHDILKQLVFVEVKARKNSLSIEENLENLINKRQIKRYINAAEHFLSDVGNGLITEIESLENWAIRYDLALIVNNKIVRWIKDITSCEMS